MTSLIVILSVTILVAFVSFAKLASWIWYRFRKRETDTPKVKRPWLGWIEVIALPLLLCGGVAAAWWHVHRYEERRFNHSAEVLCASFSVDGIHLLSGDATGIVRLWEVGNGQEVRQYPGSEGPVTCVTFSPDGRHIIAGCKDGQVRVWALEQPNAPLRGCFRPARPPIPGTVGEFLGPDTNKPPVTAVAFLPGDPNRLLIVWTDHLGIYDSDSLREMTSFERPAYSVDCVAVSPTGDRAVTGPDLQVWDLNTGRVIGGRSPVPLTVENLVEQNLYFSLGNALLGVAFSPDGTTFATGQRFEIHPKEGTHVKTDSIRVWPMSDLAKPSDFRCEGGKITSLCFEPNGTIIYGTADGILMRKSQSDSSVSWFGAHLDRFGSREITSITVHPKGGLALTTSKDKTARLWRLP